MKVALLLAAILLQGCTTVTTNIEGGVILDVVVPLSLPPMMPLRGNTPPMRPRSLFREGFYAAAL